MRPHTRTQCQDSSKCGQCNNNEDGTSSSEGSDTTFAVPAGVVRRSSSNAMVPASSAAASASGMHQQRAVLLVELPAELLVKVLSHMSFKEICDARLVSRRFNEICASMLNGAFQKVQSHMLQRFHEIKNKMPRRESARRLVFMCCC